jgi:hypothetical protein
LIPTGQTIIRDCHSISGQIAIPTQSWTSSLLLNVAQYRTEYQRVFALSPEEAKAAYLAKQTAIAPVSQVSEEEIQAILDAMNETGAWIEDLSAPDHTDCKNKPRHQFRGISKRTYTKNKKALMSYRQSHNLER